MKREYSYVARSPIHGRGLFAKRKIRKGTLIGTYEGPRVRKDGMHVLWVEDERGKWFGIDGKNQLRYLNHSRNPNAEFIGEELIALRTIAPDEEITFHYGDEWAEVD
ncbi:MAG: SET domain-containing protein-lysine N-methyltransferase [Planctomycetes bacterium]|nr:SET domain-containing protein-lysine N-methyltransferase [Planctomycetota bacterium]